MTLVGPLLIGLVFLAPIMIMEMSDDEEKLIKVVDEAHLFREDIPKSKKILFERDTMPIETAKKIFDSEKYTALLYIPSNILTPPHKAILYSEKQANIEITSAVERLLQKEIENAKMIANNINEEMLESIRTRVDVNAVKITETGEQKSSAGIVSIVGIVSSLVIYMFIFLYGAMVMRGVIEEKTSRIVEVIISSVKPFQLLMGKIIGIAMVGLTQFILWVALSLLVTTAVQSIFLDKDLLTQKTEQINSISGHTIDENNPVSSGGNEEIVAEIFDSLSSINFIHVFLVFIFYFLGGYLLYSALFGAIGAAVDNETDTQQFMLPITVPLILGIVVAQSIISNPDSSLAFWFSIIPFTSPVVMMVRLPFGVPLSELLLSMSLLVLGFLFTTWIASRIYRVGILMYGKKVSYKELGKWLFYKG